MIINDINRSGRWTQFKTFIGRVLLGTLILNSYLSNFNWYGSNLHLTFFLLLYKCVYMNLNDYIAKLNGLSRIPSHDACVVQESSFFVYLTKTQGWLIRGTCCENRELVTYLEAHKIGSAVRRVHEWRNLLILRPHIPLTRIRVTIHKHDDNFNRNITWTDYNITPSMQLAAEDS